MIGSFAQIYHRDNPGAQPPHTLLVSLVLVQTPVLIVLALVSLLAVQAQVPISAFTRDPAAIAGISPFNGALAHLGNVLWASGAGVMLFTAVLLVRLGGRAYRAGFFLYFSVFTGLLLFDDIFLIHDMVAPAIFHIPEEAAYALYAFLLAFGLWRYRALLARGAPLLGLACTFFALSIAVDVFGAGMPGVYLLEDGAKFFGIFNWCLFFVGSAASAIGDELRRPTPGPARQR